MDTFANEGPEMAVYVVVGEVTICYVAFWRRSVGGWDVVSTKDRAADSTDLNALFREVARHVKSIHGWEEVDDFPLRNPNGDEKSDIPF